MSKVDVFLYGGLMAQEVQARIGLHVQAPRRATLPGYGLRFEPWVNLKPAFGAVAFGVVGQAEHDGLAAAYAQLKTPYRPYPVLVLDDAGAQRPALCYLADAMAPGPVDPAHVAPVLQVAEALGFPAWYAQEIRAVLAAV